MSFRKTKESLLLEGRKESRFLVTTKRKVFFSRVKIFKKKLAIFGLKTIVFLLPKEEEAFFF